MAFVKATRKQQKLRLALQGPAGSGKTRKAVEILTYLMDPGQRVAVVDTEFGSASSYADEMSELGKPLDFDVNELRGNYHPAQVAKLIKEAADNGYGGIAFDSLTHFWNGPGGFLQLVDEAVAKQRARGQKGDSFSAWKEIDPIYKQMVLDILSAPIHVITCLRAKTEYEKTEGGDGKKGTIRKIGLAPEIRDTFQYEMSVEGMIDMDHNLVIGKTRVGPLDGMIFRKGENHKFAEIFRNWSASGAPEAPVPAPTAADPDTSSAEREIWMARITSSSDLEDLRNCVAPMKATGYPKMTEPHIQELRDAYAKRQAELRASANGAAS